MSREEIKRIFFELLTEDEEFKQRLTEFILAAVAENDLDKQRGEKELAESQRNELQAKCDKLADDKRIVESQRDELQAKCDKLADDKKVVESQRDELQAKCDKLSNDKRIVEGERDELQAKCDKLLGDKRIVEGERDELNRQLEILLKEKESAEKQLAERFAKGWEVYQSFLKLNAEARKNYGFHAENFETFICKGAQYKNLDGIWEAALGCKRDGKLDDAEIFWNVFEYFVQLVNFAFGDNFIEILNTQTGERYNTDIHSTSGTNSSTQGVVREVILAGYKNNNNRKIVKKSNVRVG